MCTFLALVNECHVDSSASVCMMRGLCQCVIKLLLLWTHIPLIFFTTCDTILFWKLFVQLRMV